MGLFLQSKKKMLRVGLLLPRSTLFPSFGLDILAGLKKRLQFLGASENIKLIIDNIGFGADEQEVYTKAEKMILQEDADVVIVIADNRNTEILQPLFAATNKILLAVNCGTDVAENWNTGTTTIIHTLNFSLNARLTGILAAEQENKKVVNTMSYYDAGYFQCFSMLNGNQQYGGIASFFHITKLKLSEFTLDPLEAYLAQADATHNLLCLFCGEQAEQFYKEMAVLQKKFPCQLYVTPMMLDEQLKKSLDAAFQIQNVTGFIPWHSSLENEENHIFKEQMGQEGKWANYFSLLGWDTGSILHMIDLKRSSGQLEAAAIVRSFAGEKINSPRGWILTDNETQYVYGPAYKAVCSNNFEINIVTTDIDIKEAFEAFKSVNIKLSDASSWKNTYLCI